MGTANFTCSPSGSNGALSLGDCSRAFFGSRSLFTELCDVHEKSRRRPPSTPVRYFAKFVLRSSMFGSSATQGLGSRVDMETKKRGDGNSKTNKVAGWWGKGIYGQTIRPLPMLRKPLAVAEDCAVCLYPMHLVVHVPLALRRPATVSLGLRTKLLAFTCTHGVCMDCTRTIFSTECLRVLCPICRAAPSPVWNPFISEYYGRSHKDDENDRAFQDFEDHLGGHGQPDPSSPPERLARPSVEPRSFGASVLICLEKTVSSNRAMVRRTRRVTV